MVKLSAGVGLVGKIGQNSLVRAEVGLKNSPVVISNVCLLGQHCQEPPNGREGGSSANLETTAYTMAPC